MLLAVLHTGSMFDTTALDTRLKNVWRMVTRSDYVASIGGASSG